MTFVVTEACIRCKYTHCVDLCPVNAIDADQDVPGGQQDVTPLSAKLAQACQPITKTKQALTDANSWAPITDKRAEQER